MKKIIFLSFIAILNFTACNNAPKETQKEPISADAITSATNEASTLLNVSQEEGTDIVYNFLKNSKHYFLATVEGNKPKVRPIAIAIKYKGEIWFHVGKQKACYKQIKKNPNVEIAAMDSTGNFIRIYGKAVFIEDKVLDDMLFEKHPNLKTVYNKDSGLKLGHFFISDGVADIPTDSSSVVVKF